MFWLKKLFHKCKIEDLQWVDTDTAICKICKKKYLYSECDIPGEFYWRLINPYFTKDQKDKLGIQEVE
jgi:hypothetical protein